MPRDHLLRENAMPKKDRLDDEDQESPEPKENAMPKKDEESAPVAASTEGLVKMTKADVTLHVHPTAVKAHKEQGWKHA